MSICVALYFNFIARDFPKKTNNKIKIISFFFSEMVLLNNLLSK